MNKGLIEMMGSRLKLTSLFVIFSACLSCAYSVHQVHVSDFVAPVGSDPKIVESEASQRVFMGLVFDTDYANDAHASLARKCRKGVLHGITTRHSTDLGFFNWTNRLPLRGICRIRSGRL